jgi:transposase
MTIAAFRVGIDVSKAGLDVFEAPSQTASRIPNTQAAIARLIARLPRNATIVFEATAPYDTALRKALARTGLRTLRVNPARARDFARAAGFLAKTDAVDARMLALLPDALQVREDEPFDHHREALAALHRRRDQLVDTRAVERARIASEPDADVRHSLESHIGWLTTAIEELEARIQGMLRSPPFARRAKLLATAKGVGAVTITTILALLPEIGRCSAKAIAALAGLAPINRDSATLRGRRHIAGGRRRVRQALYMAALAAIRTHQPFRQHYLAIKARSGHAKVAIIAIARKLLVTLNAMLKSDQPFRA